MRSAWCAALPGQRDPAAFPTPTLASAQRAEDQTSSGGTCCGCSLPTRGAHEGSHVREGAAGVRAGIGGAGSLGAAVQKRISERGGGGWRPER